MVENLVNYTNEGGVFRVELNRPDNLNALNRVLMKQLLEVTERAASDPSVKIYILSGAGRAFSAGVDLKETGADSFGTDSGLLPMGNRYCDLIEQMNAVTIAQVHGYCFTGALEIALMFDMMFCTDDTQFGDTHAKWAVMPRWGMTQRLARRVGLIKAKELTFRAYRVNGPEAERIGLVNRTFAKDIFVAEVNTVVGDILQNSQEAIGAIKKLYNQGWATTLSEGLEIELAADPKLTETATMLSQFEEKKKQ